MLVDSVYSCCQGVVVAVVDVVAVVAVGGDHVAAVEEVHVVGIHSGILVVEAVEQAQGKGSKVGKGDKGDKGGKVDNEGKEWAEVP